MCKKGKLLDDTVNWYCRNCSGNKSRILLFPKNCWKKLFLQKKVGTFSKKRTLPKKVPKVPQSTRKIQNKYQKVKKKRTKNYKKIFFQKFTFVEEKCQKLQKKKQIQKSTKKFTKM